jgi:hypothetical protein
MENKATVADAPNQPQPVQDAPSNKRKGIAWEKEQSPFRKAADDDDQGDTPIVQEEEEEEGTSAVRSKRRRTNLGAALYRHRGREPAAGGLPERRRTRSMSRQAEVEAHTSSPVADLKP